MSCLPHFFLHRHPPTPIPPRAPRVAPHEQAFKSLPPSLSCVAHNQHLHRASSPITCIAPPHIPAPPTPLRSRCPPAPHQSAAPPLLFFLPVLCFMRPFQVHPPHCTSSVLSSHFLHAISCRTAMPGRRCTRTLPGCPCLCCPSRLLAVPTPSPLLPGMCGKQLHNQSVMGVPEQEVLDVVGMRWARSGRGCGVGTGGRQPFSNRFLSACRSHLCRYPYRAPGACVCVQITLRGMGGSGQSKSR